MLTLLNAESIESHMCHDAGWNFVVSSIVKDLPNLARNIDGEQVLLLDLFVDKSFLWSDGGDRASLPHLTSRWIGIIHHPVNVRNSCVTLLSLNRFRSALNLCQGLIVFSAYLERELKRLAVSMHHLKLPLITVISHPVNIDLLTRLKVNLNVVRRSLYHVGHHGRQPASFLQLQCPEPYRKYLLTNGPDFIPLHAGTSAAADYRTISTTGVAFLPRLDMHQYAAALNRGIVYMQLSDASAVNTILECLVMRTPIFINRLPAVEEVLGREYPLYVESETEVRDILMHGIGQTQILAAEKHMGLLDINRYHIEKFLQELGCILAKASVSTKSRPSLEKIRYLPPCHMIPQGGTAYRKEFEEIAEKTGNYVREDRFYRKVIAIIDSYYNDSSGDGDDDAD